MIRCSIVIIAILTSIPTTATAQERPGRFRPVIRQADRILVESNDPETLFKLFAETLQLPIAWTFTDHGTYASGSVSAGDVTLEFFSYTDRQDSTANARYTGLNLEPNSLEDALTELRIMGVPYDPPQIHNAILPDGSEGPVWIAVKLPSLSHPLLPVTLFEYSPQFLNMEVRRKQFGNRLVLNEGGPLGIVSVQAVVLESEKAEKDEAEWVRFLGKPKQDGYLRPELGPAFRIVRGSRNGIQRIILKVKSFARAEAFLMKEKLLGRRNKREVFFSHSAVQGLNISLAEELPD